jgi:hypothetical protein
MSYAYFNRLLARARSGVAVAVVASLALPMPFHSASAQLGGLVKKARDRVVEQQVEKRTNAAVASSPSAAPTFDDITLELTTERVAQLVRGLTAGRAVLDGASGSPSRASLETRREETSRKRVALSDANAQVFNAYSVKRDENQRCRNDAIRALRDKRQQAFEQKQKEFQAKAMSDPAFRDKAMATAQKIAVAQQRGDTVEMRRLMAELGGVADDPKADEVAADIKCGKEPAKPAAMVQVEQLEAEEAKLTAQVRQAEEKAQATEVKESGMTERQFFMARERLEAYLSSVKYKSQPGGFSAAELEALNARRADLEKVM